MKRTLLMLLAAGLLPTGLAWAQEEDDAPGRGVARISLVNGDVSIRRGDSGEWVAAAVNAPLVVGDNVLTGVNSQAEVQFDWASFLRLGSETEVKMADLENKRYQAQVARGTVMLSVLRDTDAEIEVDTPNVSIRPVKRSDCRITVRENGESEVTVRSGEVQVFTPRGVERVQSGRTMLVRGSADNPEFQMVKAIEQDEFDQWNQDRDRRLERTRSYQYVSRDIYGADDLDAYGRWVNMPPYGWVWCPSGVGADWAPYRSGRWAWVDYYGWTWVSYDPWGWAPYHYGRWFYGAPYGWCWFPGPVYSHYFWRPALVAFFGYGGGFGFGFGFGNVGWIPLAPYERFYPWYGRGWYGYGRNYMHGGGRIVNNVNITNVYRNARMGNGVSGIDSGGFVRGGRGVPVRVNDTIARNAGVIRGPMPITPSAQSLRVSDRAASPGVSRVAVAERQFATHRQPTPAERVPFETQRQNISQMAQRTFPQAAERGGAQPAVRGGAEARPGPAASQPSGGWRQVPERTQTAQPGSPGWRQFGQRPAGQAAEPSRTPGVTQTPRQQAPNNDSWRRSGGGSSRESSPPAGRQQASPPAGRQAPSAAPRNDRGTQQRDSRQQYAPRSDAGGSQWQRFGSGASSSSRGDWQSAPSARGGGSPAMTWPRSEPRSQPLQLNAPIVRERSAPSYQRSAPSYQRSAPSYQSAPRYSAPASHGGGGGGASASRGGGGGGGGGSRGGGGGGGGHRR